MTRSRTSWLVSGFLVLAGFLMTIWTGFPSEVQASMALSPEEGVFSFVQEEVIESESVLSYSIDLSEGDRLIVTVEGKEKGILITGFIAPWGDELAMEEFPEIAQYRFWAPEDGTYSILVENTGCYASSFALHGVISHAPLPTRKVLNRDTDGETIPLVPGETFQISLDTYATAGYLWSVQEVDSALIRQVEEPATILLGTMPGAPVNQLFTFQALTTGTTDLVLANQREWESEPEELYRVTLEIVNQD